MTENNESKLKKVTERYQTLKTLAELSPVIATVLLVIVLAIEMAMLPYILKIQNSEKIEEDYYKNIPARRMKTDTTFDHILQNQQAINSKIDLIIINQSRSGPINKSTLDSLKIYLFQNYKPLK